MAFFVIENSDLARFSRQSGFRNAEFKKLAGLYSRAASLKVLDEMAVDVNMDEGVCTISYFTSVSAPPAWQFVVRHVGPRTDMYELWQHGRGRVFKSGLFDYTYEKLAAEIEALMPPPA